jgi:Polysaccharide lyase
MNRKAKETKTASKLTYLAAALTAFVALALPGAAAASGLKIVAPAAVEASKPLHFSAKPSGSTTQVEFSVDGRHRWVDSSPASGWKFGTTGSIELRTGRHLLKVRATQPGRVVTTTRTAYVVPAKKSGRAGAVRRLSRARAIASRRPAPAGELLFSASTIDEFNGNQSAPGAVTEVPDPTGSGKTVIKMTTDESDVYPVTPTSDPRSQLLSPEMIDPGEEMWWHTSFYLPNDFPTWVPGWVNILEGPYGKPFGGSPPFNISADEDEIRWQVTRQTGKWVDVLVHFRFARDGWVELWIDGQQITFFDQDRHNPLEIAPTTKLAYQTMDDSNDQGPNFLVAQNYREQGMFDSLTVYHGSTKVGTTRASVEG